MKILAQSFNRNASLAGAAVTAAVAMWLSFTATNAEIIGPTLADDLLIENWFPPKNESDDFYSMDTIVGKTITFSWPADENPQDVWIHPTGDCNTNGSIFVGPETSQDTSTSYTFEAVDGNVVGNMMFFTSHIDNHCSDGQQLSIRVFSTQQDFEVVQSGPADGGGVSVDQGSGTDGEVTADGDETGSEGAKDDSSGSSPTNAVLCIVVAFSFVVIGLVSNLT